MIFAGVDPKKVQWDCSDPHFGHQELIFMRILEIIVYLPLNYQTNFLSENLASDPEVIEQD